MDYVTSNSLKLTDKTGRVVSANELTGKAVALYFSAHWCPPCKGFTPILKSFYEQTKNEGLEIIFVSSDKSVEEGKDYFANDHGDWLMLDFSQGERLGKEFAVRGIPTLIVIDSKGKVVAPDARSQVAGANGSGSMKAVVAEWRKSCGDWRETTGSALGGTSTVSGAEAMRAARLARLSGGPVPTPAPPAPPAPDAVTTTNEGFEQAAPTADVVMEMPVAAETKAAEQGNLAAVNGPPGVDPTALEQMIAMGIEESTARHALEAAGGDVHSAVAAVTNPGEQGPVTAGSGQPGADPMGLDQMIAMGIEESTARHALEAAGGDVERAIEICFT